MPATFDTPVTPVTPAAPTSSALLSRTYRRLGELSPLLRMAAAPPGAGAGWVSARRLAEDAVLLERLVDAEERRILAAYGVAPRRDVAAMWVLHRYAFTVCLAMSGPWYLDRRVPRLTLDGVSYAWRDRALRVEADRVSCLPGDPAVGLPGVRAVGGEEALRAELRGAVAEQLGPVLEAFRPLLRRGPSALWGLASDELTEGIGHLGRLLGDQRAAAVAAGRLLPGGTAPYAGAAGFRPPAEPGGEPTRTRVGCCLYYTIRPEAVCASCPRLRQRA